jgi:prepilin-type N-terminal cleavage/methylation domain-containing protein
MIRRSEQGFTLIELLIVVAIISIIAAFAVPGLLGMRRKGNETSAIVSLKTLNTAQVAYSASCGNNGFATSFVVLGTPAPGTTDGFISADLGGSAAPQKDGYNFTIGPGAGSAAGPNDCNGTATQTTYYATAVPQAFGTSGARSFATNASSTIWQTMTNTPPPEPFAAPATPIQ